MKMIGGSYEGKFNKEGTEIAGQWRQGGQSWPLVFKRGEGVAQVNRPQEPKKPYPYDEEEVVYENKAASVKLAATLTLPRGQGLFPAVLLITGSGPQDRNETVMGHRPFLVLADHLTRQGIAVLRADDRGVGRSTGNFAAATSEDFASDALAGIEYLKSRKEVNPQQIGLIGHSEGGMIAPMVAIKSSDVAFIVLMAGPGLVGEEILYLQSALMSKVMGVGDEAIGRNRALQEKMYAIAKQKKDTAVAEKKLRELIAQMAEGLTEEQKRQMNAAPAAMESQLKMVLSPWFRYFLTYDPRPTLTRVKCPVLAINGELDLQVPPKDNLPAIAKALAAGGNKDHEVKELPKLNHLFQTAKTGSLAEYHAIEETIATVALETVSTWILKHTRR
jgi:pimeloyl-ACP methyl ester carboxylesterase